MEILRLILLIAHFVALAAILGPWLAQLAAQAKRVTMTMVWGARAQLIIGLALGAIVSMGDHDDPAQLGMKLGVKFLVTLAVVAFAEIGKKKENNNTFWLLVGLLTLVNVIVAVVV